MRLVIPVIYPREAYTPGLYLRVYPGRHIHQVYTSGCTREAYKGGIPRRCTREACMGGIPRCVPREATMVGMYPRSVPREATMVGIP